MTLRPLIARLAALLPRPRVIRDGTGALPYLSRYYLRGRPTMPDGSEPFDRFGNPKPGAVWPKGIGAYLHHFHRSDVDRELHSHPWAWSFSIVLAGGYREERRLHGWAKDHVCVRLIMPGHLNIILGDDFHRVDLIEEDAWTLFVVGPKTGTSWGFWDRETGEVTPWREFLAKSQRAD